LILSLRSFTFSGIRSVLNLIEEVAASLVQFAYLFGGEANITAAGYTYSEYAVKGFSELTTVGFLSLALILALGTWSKPSDAKQRAWLNGASTLLVVFVGVMLVSGLTA